MHENISFLYSVAFFLTIATFSISVNSLSNELSQIFFFSRNTNTIELTAIEMTCFNNPMFTFGPLNSHELRKAVYNTVMVYIKSFKSQEDGL